MAPMPAPVVPAVAPPSGDSFFDRPDTIETTAAAGSPADDLSSGDPDADVASFVEPSFAGDLADLPPAPVEVTQAGAAADSETSTEVTSEGLTPEDASISDRVDALPWSGERVITPSDARTVPDMDPVDAEQAVEAEPAVSGGAAIPGTDLSAPPPPPGARSGDPFEVDQAETDQAPSAWWNVDDEATPPGAPEAPVEDGWLSASRRAPSAPQGAPGGAPSGAAAGSGAPSVDVAGPEQTAGAAFVPEPPAPPSSAPAGSEQDDVTRSAMSAALAQEGPMATQTVPVMEPEAARALDVRRNTGETGTGTWDEVGGAGSDEVGETSQASTQAEVEPATQASGLARRNAPEAAAPATPVTDVSGPAAAAQAAPMATPAADVAEDPFAPDLGSEALDAEGESTSRDLFLEELRRAVSDEAPAGHGDEQAMDDFFGNEDEEQPKRRFGRRRR